jgi:hypothetical protein
MTTESTEGTEGTKSVRCKATEATKDKGYWQPLSLTSVDSVALVAFYIQRLIVPSVDSVDSVLSGQRL